MKHFLKIIAYLIAIIILIAGTGAAYISIKGVPNYKAEIPPDILRLKVKPDSVRIARGARIATLLCNECHKGADGKLTGRELKDVPKVFGSAASYNITHDPDHGIGKWTDGELYYFLRTGIRTNGSWAPPFMPKFPLMADEDLYSIIAWLRSDDPSLLADSREYPPNNYNFFVKFLANVAVFPPPLPRGPITIPDTANQVAFGKYIADGLCACYSCHSADFAKQDVLFPEKSLGYYGGGNPMLNLEGEIVPTANITPDKETGIGNWTQQQFYEAVKFGKNPKGGPLYYPMFPHTTLTDTEVSAIWAFIRTVPPLKNKVARYQPKN